MSILADELRKQFEPVEPMKFYREIFPEGELDELGAMNKGKYTGIAMEIENRKNAPGNPIVKRYSVTDELDVIKSLMNSKNFCILAPISYIGKSRKSENARIMYALCVELDNLIVKNGEQVGLRNLIWQWGEKMHWIPRPTYVVASGNGVHLYYLFEKGIPLFPNVVKSLDNYKRELTRMIWNMKTTTDYDIKKIQFESIFQPFRMVGTLTKSGDITEAFRTGSPVSIEYMNSFIFPDTVKKHPETLITSVYKSSLTLAEAKKKYPDWYEKIIVQKEPKGRWVCKRDLYDWWKRKIKAEAKVGHRYYCMMILAIYAVKCEISQEELEKDCFELMSLFEGRTEKEDNHFTEKDVISALQSFEDKGVVTYPLNSIVNRSGIPIERNKRRKKPLKRDDGTAFRAARAVQDIGDPDGEWRNKNGRPKGSGTAEQKVREWKEQHPDGKKMDCHRETGLSRVTIDKWW